MMQVLVRRSLREYQSSGFLTGEGTDERERETHRKGTD